MHNYEGYVEELNTLLANFEGRAYYLLYHRMGYMAGYARGFMTADIECTYDDAVVKSFEDCVDYNGYRLGYSDGYQNK